MRKAEVILGQGLTWWDSRYRRLGLPEQMASSVTEDAICQDYASAANPLTFIRLGATIHAIAQAISFFQPE